jgi:hypothetical protein
VSGSSMEHRQPSFRALQHQIAVKEPSGGYGHAEKARWLTSTPLAGCHEFNGLHQTTLGGFALE